MNILLISLGFYPCVIGGMEIFNKYLAQELAKRGHNIYILTTCESKWINKSIGGCIYGIYIDKNKRHKKCIRLFSISINMIYEVAKLRKTVNVVLIPYTSNSPLIYPALLFKKLFKLPYIVTIHGGGMHPWKCKLINKKFFNLASQIIAVSKPIKEEYETRTNKKILVIPPMIPFSESEISKEILRKKYGFCGNSKIILAVGTIKEIKGSNILLEAFLGLGQAYIKNYKISLVYVGDGPLRHKLEREIEGKELNQYIKFVGAVPREKVSDFYKLSDIYVIPSLFEGTPIALLEAMFNGMPIIGTDTPGINNLIKSMDNGLLFEKDNAQDLANKIQILVSNQVLSDRLSESAKSSYNILYKFDDVVFDYLKLMEFC